MDTTKMMFRVSFLSLIFLSQIVITNKTANTTGIDNNSENNEENVRKLDFFGFKKKYGKALGNFFTWGLLILIAFVSIVLCCLIKMCC